MFMRLINKVLGGGEEPKRQPTTAELAREIDKHFDGMLFEGMPMDQAIWVERQRAAAHAALTQLTLSASLDGWHRPG